MKTSFALFGLLALAPTAFADTPQLFKWSDARGVIHYSDQPPEQSVADLKTSDVPTFPAVDQAKLDKELADLIAQAAALQQLTEAQARAQAEARLAAAQLAAQETPTAIPAADDSYSPAPIYVHSAFVPRVYRANLYLPRRPAGHAAAMNRLPPARPAMPISPKP